MQCSPRTGDHNEMCAMSHIRERPAPRPKGEAVSLDAGPVRYPLRRHLSSPTKATETVPGYSRLTFIAGEGFT